MGLFSKKVVQTYKCPMCGHVEQVEVKVTAFSRVSDHMQKKCSKCGAMMNAAMQTR